MKGALARMLGNAALALGYDSGESSRMRKDLGWGRLTPRDEDGLVEDGTREITRQKCYDLRRNNGLIAGLGDRIALWCVGELGIRPQATTTDSAWNQASEDWWADWGLACDSRGRLNIRRLQELAISMRPTHGGFYLQRTEDGRVIPIECERIRQPRGATARDGWRDGVRVNRATGNVTAYCVHSRAADGTFSAGSTQTVIDAETVLPVTSPVWRLDMVREMPDLAPTIPALQCLHEMDAYVRATAKAHSGIVAWLQRQAGQGVNSGVRGSTPTVGQRQVFEHAWGQVMHLNAGETINSFDSKTPTNLHIPYMEFSLKLIAPVLGFPYEFFTLDFTKADYARMKGLLLLINKAARPWQQWLVESMLRPLWNWRIGLAIERGELPPAPTETINGMAVSQWRRVSWQTPEEVWLDRQEAQQADLLEYQLGMPLEPAHRRRGGQLENNLRAKAREIKLAERIGAEEGVDPARLVNASIPGQTPSGSAASPSAQPATGDDERQREGGDDAGE